MKLSENASPMVVALNRCGIGWAGTAIIMVFLYFNEIC